MALLGERVDATTAERWGLVNRVFEDDEFEAEADRLVGRLAAGPTRSYAGTKRQLNHRIYQGLDEQLELEAQIQREMAGTQDFLEGVTAFVQKREPRYSGS
jgi:2-(1,2-epoxy-1,2-dihydrophenyl)acetyl-CoA isomerase